MNVFPRNILVVDDSLNDYETYVRYLQKAGKTKYKTKYVPLGKELFSGVHDHPDCLLLDLTLPDMSGLDIIARLKAANNQSLPYPVVMVTGSGNEATGETAVRLGAQDYLIKEEVTVESLPRAIEFAISRFAFEQQLRASEERARHLAANMKLAADASGIGFWSFDAATRIASADENNRKSLGLPLTGAVTFEDFLAAIHEEDRSGLQAKVEECLRTGASYDEEFRVIHEDGSVHWLAARGSLINDSNGKPTGMTGMALDITERKRIERVMREDGQRMRIAHEAAQSGIWEWNLRERKLILSPEVEALYGLTPGSFAGDMERWRNMTNPEDAVVTERLLDQALAEKSPNYQSEFRITRSDGSERWIEAFAKIFYDDDGTPLNMVGVNIDITERKTIARALSNSEWRARQLIESNIIPVVFAQASEITGANDAFLKMVGYSRNDLEQGTISWVGLTPEEHRSAAAGAERDLKSEGFFHPFEQEYFRKDGSRVPILIGGTLLKADPLECVCFILDLSELKRTEAELEGARKDLEGRVEARTGELSRALLELKLEAESRAMIEETLRELSAKLLRLQDEERRRIARDLHDTTGQTLTALKISTMDLKDSYEAGSDHLSQKFEEIMGLADQALKEIRTTSYLLHPPLLDEAGFCAAARWYAEGFSKRSGVELNLDLQERHKRPGIAIETALFRVMQESLTNIIRHSGSLKADVKLRFDEDDVTLSIRDFGQGIAPERLVAFDLSGSGMGVGLAGMRERLRELGGQLNVESGPNGTCVTATLRAQKSKLDDTGKSYAA